MSTPGKIICLHPVLQVQQFNFDQVKQTIEGNGFIIGTAADTTLAAIWLFDSPGDVLSPDYLQALRSSKSARILLIWLGAAALPAPTIWKLFAAGVNDLIHWNGQQPAADILVNRLNRWAHIERNIYSPLLQETLAGSSPVWRNALREMVEIAMFSQAPVLITGESGTGKEMAARLIHHFDIRPFKQELTLLDCSAIAPELSGSEFFGHEKGAFTNAISSREGAFATADKGTLFLDEIGELPITLQAELLRVAQEGTYKKVGGNTWRKTEFRLVCATNRDLLHEIATHHFRQDLYYRISTWVCTLPPLRERRADIPELVQCFLQQIFPDPRKRPVVDPLVLAYLQTRDYPGNVRELRQLVTRMTNRYAGAGVITLGDIPEQDRQMACWVNDPLQSAGFINCLRASIQEGKSLKTMVNDISLSIKEIAIEESDGNLQKAAETLQVSDRTLQLYQSAKVERCHLRL